MSKSHSKTRLKHLLCYDVLIIITQSSQLGYVIVVVAHLIAVFFDFTRCRRWRFKDRVDLVLMQRFTKFFQRTWILGWKWWGRFRVVLFRERHWRSKTAFGIVKWSVSRWRWNSRENFCRWLFMVRRIQINRTSFRRLVPSPRRSSATFRSSVIRRRPRRCILRGCDERFVFGWWLETRVPILKINSTHSVKVCQFTTV